jgi:proton-dependent oligopeptide transporter, POT family
VEGKSYRHPSSLPIFFATEMWERYGFYVVQTLLALYLALHFNWPDKQIYTLIGSFTALTYISPVIGGWIADHLIGQKRATLLGTLLLFISYLILSLQAVDRTLPFALGGIAVGTGLLKSNISSLLGNQYSRNSASRESGFTIFYMGITSGIIIGTTLPSYLNRHFGWSMSFMSAAIGILIGMLTFLYGIYRYRIEDYSPYQFNIMKTCQAFLILLVLWVGAFLIILSPKIADSVFILVASVSVLYLMYCVSHESKQQSKKTLVILLLCIISAMFWAFYFQMFLSLTLFIVRVVKPMLAGVPFPPPYYVAIQSLGMIVIGTFLARNKRRRSLVQKATHAGDKFVFAMIIMTLAYALITWATHLSLLTSALLSPLWIIPTYLCISLAELLLSPVGLCAVTVLANPKRVSTMMGIFFVSLGMGGFLSGKFASITAIPLNNPSLAGIKLHYELAFTKIFWILASLTVISVGLNMLIRRLMRDIH